MSDHAEYFPSLESAREELRNRYNGWADIRRVRFDVDGIGTISDAIETTRTPAVDSDSYMDLYAFWSDGSMSEEIAKRIEFGPRMGITTTNG